MAFVASSCASTASASPSAIATKASTNYIYRYPSSSSSSMLSFHLSRKPKLRLFAEGSPPSRMSCPKVKPNDLSFFQREGLFSSILCFLLDMLSSKVAGDGSPNATADNKTKSNVAIMSLKDTKPSSEQPSSGVLETEESISHFISQIASLIELVDSRDIVELQLKQHNFEVTIRKKEAIPQPRAPAEVAMIHSPSSLVVSAVTKESTPTFIPVPSTPSLSTSTVAVNSAKSSLLPLKCPMAGTFYRSPAPGEPPFVKVGDKVEKGQILCIIEAMTLMNEIEADQSGTIADVLMEDAKPVTVGTPLFVIEP